MLTNNFLRNFFDPIPIEHKYLAAEFLAEAKADFGKVVPYYLLVGWIVLAFFFPVDYFYFADHFPKLFVVRLISILVVGGGAILTLILRGRHNTYWISWSTGILAALFNQFLVVISQDATNPYNLYLIGIMLVASVVSWPTIWAFTGNIIVLSIYFSFPFLLSMNIDVPRFSLISAAIFALAIALLFIHNRLSYFRWTSFYNRHRAEEIAIENASLYGKVKLLNSELEHYNQNLEQLVQEQVQEISDSQMAMIFALAKLAESRDNETGKHLERVQIFCRLLAEQLSETPHSSADITPAFIHNIYHASPLHDIGKVGISDNILLKPSRLSEEEFEIMKQHTAIGATTLVTVRDRYPKNHFIDVGISIARSHHERWDGTGYPDGLAGDKIPLPARIMAVADTYDALRSKRCYKAALTHEESKRIILEGKGTSFDPEIILAFCELDVTFKNVSAQMDDV